MLRRRIDTNNSRLGESGEIGQVFGKTDPGFSCGTNFRKRRANLKCSQTQIGQVAEEHAAAQQEDAQLQVSHLIKMWCKTPAVVALSFSGSRIVRLIESVGQNNGTHIDVQRPRCAHGWSGTETSGHQLFVDPRESCQQ